MFELKVNVLHGEVSIDKCSNCAGIWFDSGEAEQLKEEWASDSIDTGDPKMGRAFNKIKDIACPRCSKIMLNTSDPKQKNLQFEICEEHGMFMDAGEFNEYKLENTMDFYRGFGHRKT